MRKAQSAAAIRSAKFWRAVAAEMRPRCERFWDRAFEARDRVTEGAARARAALHDAHDARRGKR